MFINQTHSGKLEALSVSETLTGTHTDISQFINPVARKFQRLPETSVKKKKTVRERSA